MDRLAERLGVPLGAMRIDATEPTAHPSPSRKTMKRGEICWYTFAAPDKCRPILLLTREPMVRRLNDVTVASITTTLRNLDSEVRLTIADGMPTYERSINLTSNLRERPNMVYLP